MISQGTRKTRERGSAIVEFCLSSLVWLPLLLGTSLFGTAMVRAIQVAQLSRDSGRMYARGVDFTSRSNATLLAKLAAPLSIQAAGGSGAIVLSTVTLATQSDCAAANMKVCPNINKYVFTHFFIFGNTAYAQTQLGHPGLGYLTHGSAIEVWRYLSDPALVASNFSDYLRFVPGQPGQLAYVSEVTVNSQTITWTEFSNTRSYARTFF